MEFMKSARKAALTFMLPASLLMSAPACAGNLAASDPPREAPAARADKAGESLPQGVTTISLEETGLDPLLKQHPFLEKYLASPETPKEEQERTRFYQKTLKDPESKTDLLFVSAVGLPFCGTEGCLFYIFRREDNKPYSLIKTFNLPFPSISVLKEGERLSLIADAADGGQGFWTWDGANKKYQYSGPYRDNPQPPRQ